MHTSCAICDRIKLIQQGKNPYFVTELSTGYVVIGDHQFYKGYTVFLHKEHAEELHELLPEVRNQSLKEMALVAEAVFNTFKPDKLNYELLGNTDRHIHWHIFPRRKTDLESHTAVWAVDPAIRYDDKTKPSKKELQTMTQQLAKAINQLKEVS